MSEAVHDTVATSLAEAPVIPVLVLHGPEVEALITEVATVSVQASATTAVPTNMTPAPATARKPPLRDSQLRPGRAEPLEPKNPDIASPFG